MQRLMNAQAAFVATHVARLTRLAKSARQVIDEPEIDVRVVAASATSRRCSTLQRPISGRPVNRGKDRFRPILLKVRQAKPGGVGSHVKENATENF
jgi:hypothetical protein